MKPKIIYLKNEEFKIYLWSYLKNNAIYTGSNRFGLATEKSDYDFVIKIDDWYGIVQEWFKDDYNNLSELCNKNLTPEYPFLNYKLQLKDKWLDFIVVSEEDFNIWKKCNDQFLIFLINDKLKEVFKNKQIRVDVFEELKKINGGK